MASIGNPPRKYTLMVDTGSPDTWIMGGGCQSKACSAHRLYDSKDSSTSILLPGEFRMTYASGEIKGRHIKDVFRFQETTNHKRQTEDEGVRLTFGQLAAPPMPFQKKYRWYPFDGVLGLGLPEVEDTAKSPRLKSVTFIDKILRKSANTNEGDLQRLNKNGGEFSLYFSKGQQSKQLESQLIIGPADRQLYVAPLKYVYVDRPASFWSTRMSSLSLGAKSFCRAKDVCQIVFDTGSTLISGPEAMVDALLSQIKVNADCDGINDLPTLEMTIGGPTSTASTAHKLKIELTPEDYVARIPVKNSSAEACFIGIVPHKLPAEMGSIWTLGSRFHQKYYTVFDPARLRVGIALAA
ncbi:hypothetical protein AAMO2058_000275400 [Amorphochlora amoebiformis]